MPFIRLSSSSASASGTWRTRNTSHRHIHDSYAITFSSTLDKSCDGSIRTCTRCLQGIKKCVNHFPFYFMPLAFAWFAPLCIQYGQFTHCCKATSNGMYKTLANPFLTKLLYTVCTYEYCGVCMLVLICPCFCPLRGFLNLNVNSM
jgi:hypothetical protein